MTSTHRIVSSCTLSLCLTLTSCAGLGINYPGANTNPSMKPPGQSSLANRSGNITAAQARALAAASGLTGQRALPPGIARNLARGKALPPGIAKKALPQSMLSGLPSIDDHEWVQIGRDLALVAIGTLIVVEILDNVFQ